MAEGEAAWREIVSDVSSTSTNRRIRAWEKISAASHGAGPEDEGGDGDGVRAENAILAIEIAAGVYSDKVSKAALRKAIRSWINSEDFVKLSVVAVAKRQKEIARYVLPSHQRYILMDWVCSLIVKLRESKQLKAENAMIATASQLLTAALQDSQAGRPKVWFLHKRFADRLFDAGEQGSFDSLASRFLQETKEPGLIRLLSERREVQQHGSAETRSALLKIFVETVVTAKGKPRAVDVEACIPLAASLSAEEFGSQVMPGVQRMMKRSPEVITSTLGVLIPELKLNLSEWAAELMAAAVAQLQSSDQKQRVDATRAAQALCEGASSPDLLQRLADHLADHVSSKKAKQWYERQQVAVILTTASRRAVQLRMDADFFNGIAKTLFDFFGKEGNESAKAAILDALSGFASRVHGMPA